MCERRSLAAGALGTAVTSTTFICVLRDTKCAQDERLSTLLADIAESERLAAVGEAIIDCTTGDELIARVEDAAWHVWAAPCGTARYAGSLPPPVRAGLLRAESDDRTSQMRAKASGPSSTIAPISALNAMSDGSAAGPHAG